MIAPAARKRRFAARAALAATTLAAAFGPAAPAAVARPDPDAEAAIVVDAGSGEVLLAEGADERHPIASPTKLMTALLVMERARPKDIFTAARYDAARMEWQIGLETGERMRMRDLLTALLLESANDAAVTIATNVSGSRRAFVRDMNRRAAQLGLRSTSYANPIGLDSRRNRSSARDLASLARVLLRERGSPPPWTGRRRGSAAASAAARSATATRSSAPTRSSRASRPATPSRPATCSSARARAAASR